MKDISKFRSMIDITFTKLNLVTLMKELTTALEDNFEELEISHPVVY